jgi:hypothetical protein
MCLSTALGEEGRDQAWKLVSSQSERQFGAFVFLHAALVGTAPEVLSMKQREFRNDVIHKGYIPARAEALDYGERVRHLIETGIRTIHAKFPKEVGKAINLHLQAARASVPKGTRVATMSIPTIVCFSRTELVDKPLEALLPQLQRTRTFGLVG